MSTIRQLRLSGTAAQFMLGNCREWLPRETGGILVGRLLNGCAEIIHAVGPGPNAFHSPNGFRRDGAYTQEQLDILFAASGGQEDYLGEWHSHPAPVAPSTRDRESLSWISHNPDYACPSPLLLIYQREKRGNWKLCGYQWRKQALHRLPVILRDHRIEEPASSW